MEICELQTQEQLTPRYKRGAGEISRNQFLPYQKLNNQLTRKEIIS